MGDVDLHGRWRDDLYGRWHDLVAPWGAADREIDRAGRAVVSRWAEAHRRYHTTVHLREVLAAVDALADLAHDRVAVELAAWLHDAVYDPRAAGGANEAASADLATFLLIGLQVPVSTISEVGRLILSTASHHVEANDPDGAVLADADLSILGAPQDRYRRYAAEVRAEFGFVDDHRWRAGRSAVLRDFADRSRLFVTDRAQATLGVRAGDNLQWELAALGGREPEARIP